MTDEEIMSVCDALAPRFADRLTESDISFIAELAQVGEWDLALDELVAALTEDGRAITPRERDDLVALAEALSVNTDEISALAVDLEG